MPNINSYYQIDYLYRRFYISVVECIFIGNEVTFISLKIQLVDQC